MMMVYAQNSDGIYLLLFMKGITYYLQINLFVIQNMLGSLVTEVYYQ